MKRVFLIITSLIVLNSCTNYYISVTSLQTQFNGIDSSKMKDVTMKGPFLDVYHYKANPINIIACKDKNGKEYGLKNGPSIETRITHGYKNKRTIFYFDRVMVVNGILYGVESRFLPGIKAAIPLDSIKRIEVQDGGKNYKYVN